MRALIQDGQNQDVLKGKAGISDDAFLERIEDVMQDPDLSVDGPLATRKGEERRGVSSTLTCVVFVTGGSISLAAVDAAIKMVK